MAKTREIQRRIKSIANIRKITKAMEMVSAAKMRKAIEAVLKTRTYANLSWEMVLNLAKLSAKQHEPMHHLLAERHKIKKVLLILITSNRGLCGSLNTAIINKAKESIIKHPTETDVVLIGHKGIGLANASKIIAEFPKTDLVSSINEILPIAKMVMEEYVHRHYDKVILAYTDFINATRQIPRVKQLLPIDVRTKDQYLGVVGQDPKIGMTKELIKEESKKHLIADGFVHEYVFEPSPKEVLNKIVPKLIEVQLYQALLESNAAEHSARMAAMHQATSAAVDIVSELTLFYNKARQASITSELAEISAGANALA